MKAYKRVEKISLILIFVLLSTWSSLQAQIKVACVGNSITENYALPDDEKYPAILQSYLGSGYEVRNYGLGGRTLLKSGNKPYWDESKYTEVLNWQPDIVIIELGTNDAKPTNWVYKDQFQQDYIDFINSFKNLSSTPEIYVCYPLVAFSGNSLSISDATITDEVIPLITNAANATGATTIDLHSAFEGRDGFVYDKIHPNVKGTTLMANIIGNAVCKNNNCAIPDLPEDFFARISSIDYTDKASNITSSETSNTEKLENLTDNDISTEFSVPYIQNMWLKVSFKSAIKLTGYSFTVSKDTTENPKAWKIQGSNDGSSWTDIDTQSGRSVKPLETLVIETPYTSLTALNAYKYFRILITANNGSADLSLRELQLFGFPLVLEGDITKNGGTITGQYIGVNSNELVANLIDGNLGKKYCATQSTGWVQYQSPDPVIVNRYSITSCVNLFERNLKSWELQGSNNGTNWTVLDTRNNEDFMTKFNLMEFTFDNSTAYTYYRLNILENNGSTYFQFAEWQLFDKNAVEKLKVACVGNSITEGFGLSDEQKYPYILQNYIGTNYDVRNYGVSGRTLLKNGNYPYWNESKYQEVLAWEPDIVIIKLGTNDSKPVNWDPYGSEFEADYNDFVTSFQNLSSNPKIYLCYPLVAFPNNWVTASDSVIVNGEMPVITKIAEEKNLAGVIDLHTPFKGKEELTIDKVHPNFRGTTLMANIIAKAICPACNVPDLPDDFFARMASSDYTDKATAITTSALNTTNLNNLTDDNISTEFLASYTPNMWFQASFDKAIKLTGYALTASKDTTAAPKSWKLQASSDGNLWTDIDTQSDVSIGSLETSVIETPYSEFDKLNAYKYFRLQITENKGNANLALREWQLFGFPETLESGITQNGGTITGQYVGVNSNELIDNLIDGKLNKKYCTAQSSGWVQYQSPVAAVVNKYGISSCVNLFERNPKSWELQASNDGSNWTILDSQTNEDFMTKFNLIEYEFDNSQPYNYYRLNILENNGDSYMQFSEWQLFEKNTTSIHNVSLNANVYVKKGMLFMKTESPTNYRIINTTGQVVKSGNIGSSELSISLQHPNIYIVQLYNNDGSKNLKIAI